ncbi:uncharacterized protein H6S33_007984 [Morchella sextelata]|uniref:uncharacterized protein n=1 Tax=Morchella sextelata TaxID=1174677 RepID=UPI001D0471B5|nr:uncharacterized protein H6S33_007984 [Morchella sextelata]KAH0602980.1 hypothetical protein H6S33_007984 [Morchella sextelata]
MSIYRKGVSAYIPRNRSTSRHCKREEEASSIRHTASVYLCAPHLLAAQLGQPLNRWVNTVPLFLTSAVSPNTLCCKSLATESTLQQDAFLQHVPSICWRSYREACQKLQLIHSIMQGHISVYEKLWQGASEGAERAFFRLRTLG